MLDTNVILHSAQALNSFEDNEVVIPMTVIEELDKFKRNQDELGRNTRQAIRQIDALRQKEESLQKKLDDILAKLADKRGKLKEAEKRLADLKRQVAASEQRQDELQQLQPTDRTSTLHKDYRCSSSSAPIHLPTDDCGYIAATHS